MLICGLEEIEEFFKVGSNPLPITDEQKADEKRFREEAVAEMEVRTYVNISCMSC